MGVFWSGYGIEEPAQASNMIFAVKRHLQGAFSRQLRQSVTYDEEICGEMAALRQFLAGKWQYPAMAVYTLLDRERWI